MGVTVNLILGVVIYAHDFLGLGASATSEWTSFPYGPLVFLNLWKRLVFKMETWFCPLGGEPVTQTQDFQTLWYSGGQVTSAEVPEGTAQKETLDFPC